MRILSEYENKQICRCCDDKCKFQPLKHLQKCPKCNAEAWHHIIKTDLKELNKASPKP